tara:strand:+ start:20290 stop:21381 length:1092 start_codon:yes stop_codon:yes gene_type:complete
MKTLLVIDSLGSGGAQRQMVNLAIGLSKAGLKVELIYYQKNEFYLNKLLENNITVHIPEKSTIGFSISFLLKLRKLLKRDFYNVISFLHTPSIYTSISNFAIKKNNHIVCERSSSNSTNLSFIDRFLFYVSMLNSKSIVANSYCETQKIKKLYGLSNKTKTIWNGYEIDKKSIFKKKKTHNNLLVLGRISYVKNGINLMKGLSLFLERNGWCPELRWGGRIDSNSEKVYNEMKKYLLKNKSLSKNWSWLGEVDNINDLFNESDALISCSLWEGLPNVVCESMLQGCNVLASNVCENPRLLKNGEYGLLFDPHSPIEICKSIENFYKIGNKKRLKLAKKAMIFAKQNLNIDKMVNSFLELMHKN